MGSIIKPYVNYNHLRCMPFNLGCSHVRRCRDDYIVAYTPNEVPGSGHTGVGGPPKHASGRAGRDDKQKPPRRHDLLVLFASSRKPFPKLQYNEVIAIRRHGAPAGVPLYGTYAFGFTVSKKSELPF